MIVFGHEVILAKFYKVLSSKSNVILQTRLCPCASWAFLVLRQLCWTWWPFFQLLLLFWQVSIIIFLLLLFYVFKWLNLLFFDLFFFCKLSFFLKILDLFLNLFLKQGVQRVTLNFSDCALLFEVHHPGWRPCIVPRLKHCQGCLNWESFNSIFHLSIKAVLFLGCARLF